MATYSYGQFTSDDFYGGNYSQITVGTKEQNTAYYFNSLSDKPQPLTGIWLKGSLSTNASYELDFTWTSDSLSGYADIMIVSEVKDTRVNQWNTIGLYTLKHSVKLRKDSNYQFIFSVPSSLPASSLGATQAEDLVRTMIVFKNNNGYISSAIQENSAKISALIDLVPTLTNSQGKELVQLGIQGIQGDLISINNSEFRIGRSGVIEINDKNIFISHLSIVSTSDKHPFIIDYKY